MPSSKSINEILVGPGKLHNDVAAAAADYQTGPGAEAMSSVVEALNQAVAVPTSATVHITAGATSITVDAGAYGPIWLGNPGDAIPEVLDLVSTSNNARVSTADGLPIFVSYTTPTVVGGGFSTHPSLVLNLSGAISTTGYYKLLFSKRVLLRSVPSGMVAAARKFIPDPSAVETSLREIKWGTLYNPTHQGNWSTTPTTDLHQAALFGLEDRYNRATVAAGTPSLNTPGDGGLIRRTGQALTLQATAGTYDYTAPPPDPFNALVKTTAGPQANSTTLSIKKDGGSGFVSVLQQRLTASTHYLTGTASASAASSIEVIERYLDAATIGGANVRTRVTPGLTTGAALNPDDTDSVDDRRTIKLADGDFLFNSTTGQTEVAVGYDMLEITYPSGAKQVCVITDIHTGFTPEAQFARVRAISGDHPNFPESVTTGVSFKFLKVKSFQGVGLQSYMANTYSHIDPVRLGYAYHAVPPCLTDSYSAEFEVNPDPPTFVARGVVPGDTNDASVFPLAMVWGGFSPTLGRPVTNGRLYGDGHVQATLLEEHVAGHSVSTTSTITWNPDTDGAVLDITLAHSSGAIVVTVAFDAAFSVWAGKHLTVAVHNTNAAASATFVWPGGVSFSGSDGAAVIYGAGTVHIYNLTSTQSGYLATLSVKSGAGS